MKMKNKPLILGIIIGVLIIGSIYFLTKSNQPKITKYSNFKVVVYKTPTCGCCSEYINYLKAYGFNVETKLVNDYELENLKKQTGIPPELWSCHTAFITRINANLNANGRESGITRIDANMSTQKNAELNTQINADSKNNSNSLENTYPHESAHDIRVNPRNNNPRESAYNIRVDQRKDLNYFIEGHVPIEAIDKLLTEKPEINGIALPQMPSGSPGMPGLKLYPFKIHSVKENKDLGIFMEI